MFMYESAGAPAMDWVMEYAVGGVWAATERERARIVRQRGKRGAGIVKTPSFDFG
jgi:hypothetical protein